MSTNAVDSNYNKPAYYVSPNSAAQVNSSETEDVSIYDDVSNKKETSTVVDLDYASTDGKDDGVISTGEKIESVGKGIIKSAAKMVTAPFTELAKGNFLPAAMVAGGALLCMTPIGAPIAVLGGIAGGVKGISDIIGGLKKADEIANSGTGTDGEAKAAYEQVGAGALTTGLSATAVFGGLKTMKGKAGSKMNELTMKAKAGEKVGFGEKMRAFGSDSVSATKQTFGKLTGKTAAAGVEASSTPDADGASQGQQADPSQQPASGQSAAQSNANTSQSGHDISGATKLTKSQKASLTPDELSTYQANRNSYCNPKGGKSGQNSPVKDATGSADYNPGGDNWQASRADVDAKVRTNAKTEATQKNLTVEQAKSELETAQQMLQEGVDNRNLTKGDYKAGEELVREAKANYDYAVQQQQSRQDLASRLQQAADLRARQQAQQILESQGPQANADAIVSQARDAASKTGTAGQTSEIQAVSSVSEAEILNRSQAQFDAQEAVNASWGRKPSAQDTEAYANWETQHKQLESVLKAAEQALQELFPN